MAKITKKNAQPKKKEEKKAEWKPEPKVDVEPPHESENICMTMTDPYTKCGHTKAMHYGGAKGHCNTSGCLCQEFK